MNREEIINLLVQDDIDTIRHGIHNNDTEYLANILKFGKPYDVWTDKELVSEYKERVAV